MAFYPPATPILTLPRHVCSLFHAARAQREAFAKKRNAHYGNEAEALKIAQALAAKDDEEEDDDDDNGVPNGGPNGTA